MAQDIARRSFHGILIKTLGAAMTAIVGVPAAAYLLMKPKSNAPEDFVEIAVADALPAGRPQEVLFTRTRVDGWKRVQEKTSAWLVKDDAGKISAFAPACTHLGCAYHWEADAKSFVCPCHDSIFDISGKVKSGPAPRPLDRLIVEIDNGRILINPNSKSEEA